MMYLIFDFIQALLNGEWGNALFAFFAIVCMGIGIGMLCICYLIVGIFKLIDGVVSRITGSSNNENVK